MARRLTAPPEGFGAWIAQQVGLPPTLEIRVHEDMEAEPDETNTRPLVFLSRMNAATAEDLRLDLQASARREGSQMMYAALDKIFRDLLQEKKEVN